MKALAIRQPYASLVISGVKQVENRSWATHYRGPLAIYASKAFTAADMRDERAVCEKNGTAWPGEFPTGVILGVVDLVGIFHESGQDEKPDFALDDIGQNYSFLKRADKSAVMAAGLNLTYYDYGAIGWVFANPRPIQLVRFSGRLGLFEIPDDLIKVP